jgi:hypothetical protein
MNPECMVQCIIKNQSRKSDIHNLFRKILPVGTGNTTATGQPSPVLIVDLIVGGAVKTKNPVISLA